MPGGGKDATIGKTTPEGGLPVRPTVLHCNLSPDKLAALRLLAARMGMKLTAVPPERQGMTAAQLLSGDEAAAETTPFTEELLVLCGFGGGQLDLLLRQLRQHRAAVALKAVLTPTNRDWPLTRLYAELCAERDAFARGETAHRDEK